MNELALFAGAGGGILAGYLLGWKTVCAVEIEDYPRRVLLQRQKDGLLSRFPIWDDIKTFNGKPWKGRIDIITGGFPCQDISAAGKGKGITGEKSGLWKEMSRVVCEVRPRFVFVENSPILTSRGLGVVLGDLAKMGYDARWCVLGADDVGAMHRRKRIWVLAYAEETRRPRNVFTNQKQAFQNIKLWERDTFYELLDVEKQEYAFESEDQFILDGMASGMDELKAIGNGQVPAVAATAFIILSEGLI